MLALLTSRSPTTSHTHCRPDSRPRPLHIPGQASAHVRSLIAFFNRKSQEPAAVSRPHLDRNRIPPNKVRSMVQSWLRVTSSAPSPGGGGAVVTRTSHTSPVTLRAAMEFPPQEVDSRLRAVAQGRAEEEGAARRRRREGGGQARYVGTPETEIVTPMPGVVQPLTAPRLRRLESEITRSSSLGVEVSASPSGSELPRTPERGGRKRYGQPGGKGHTEPEKRYTGPEKRHTEPEKRYTGPEKRHTEPEKRYTEPEKRYTEPENRYTEKRCTEPENRYTEKRCTEPEKRYTEKRCTEKRCTEPEGKSNDPRMAYAGQTSPASRALSALSKRSSRSSWKGTFQSVRDSFRRGRRSAAESSGMTGSAAATGSSVSVAGSPARTGSSASKLSAELRPDHGSRSKYIESLPATPSPDPLAAGYITAPDTFGASKNLMSAVQTHVTRRSLMEPAASEENLLPGGGPGQQPLQNGAAVNISSASQAPPTCLAPLSQSIEEPNTLTAVGELSRWNKSPRSARPRALTKRTAGRRAIPESFRRPQSPTRTRTHTHIRKESPLKPISPLRVTKDKSAQSTITPAAAAAQRNVAFTTIPNPAVARLTRASMDTLTSFELQPPASLSSSSDVLREPPPGRKAALPNMRFESLSSLDTPPPNPPQAIRSPTLIREMAFPALRMRGDAGQDTADTQTPGGGEGEGGGGRRRGWKTKRGKNTAAVVVGKGLPAEKGEKSAAAPPPKRVIYADTDWRTDAEAAAAAQALIDLQSMQMQFNDGQGGSPVSASDAQGGSSQESGSGCSQESGSGSGSRSSPREREARRDSMSLSISYIMPAADEGGGPLEASFRDLEMGLPAPSTAELGREWYGYGVRPLGAVTAVGRAVAAAEGEEGEEEEPVARGRRRRRRRRAGS